MRSWVFKGRAPDGIPGPAQAKGWNMVAVVEDRNMAYIQKLNKLIVAIPNTHEG